MVMHHIMEQNLNSSQLEYVFRNMDDSVCVTTKTGVLSYYNNAAKNLFSIKENAADKEIKIWSVIPYVERNDNLIQLFIDAIAAKESTFHDIVEYEKNDGSVCKLRVSITYSQEESELFIIVITNLTELFRISSAFERYTSTEIADFVLNTPEGEKRGGVSKEVTILMSDIRGFTALSTKKSPSDLIKILNNYFEKMVEVIEKHHGSVIEFLGDGIFVLFGAPKDDPDHATNAVKCAIEMQNAVVTANKWNRSHGYDELQMGVGINSGITVVGNIGSEKKMKYGCIGEAVNIAGRVETYTIGGQIYISESTKKLIREDLVIEGVQSMLPKGARTEISIFDISGIGNYHIDRSNKINWLSGCRPVDITFFEIDGKHVGEDPFSGRIESLSADERFAKLMTCKNMPERSNIMIDIGGDLYAKVIEAKDGFYTICFTSKPDSFADWAEIIK